MTLFEFVLAFSSVISALALGHLLAGAVHILRRRHLVRFSLTHALWMYATLAMTMGNWAADWSLRALTEWPAWTVLWLITSKIAQYALCVFVTPEFRAEDEKIDLVAFYDREGRNVLWAMIAFCFIAFLFNIAFSGFYGSWLRDSVITIVAFAFTVLALIIRARWAQTVTAAAIAALSTYFLIATSTLGTG
ncbi:MAG: hypothetical protein IPG56_00020 [Caulobacteraceae bacterium]|nr:hypothetical protein [Caulobacteraceae bacterium]